ncbi:AarF/ABC1/UbiB kinase family protein [Streptomyces sp. b94]|uniref:ABC1 kinase family protein n=1 Tax=Streptomyces sp. b94 TaxID=1827634 RepID=UPI001B379332|nr:AarF/UbiB family protein [Streptomyces sp. b94]MBQ1100630.1 AarF/ABC1/UbiB kinase family protein [Streptomyces sp. b94]
MGADRARVVCTTFGRLLFRETAHELTRRLRPAVDGARSEEGRTHAAGLREALEGLGPFYIKVGQLLSTRPDIVSPAVIQELAKLHDQVTITPFADFEPVLAGDLGPRWATRFREIDTDRPLGAASLAQVYRAVLTDGTPVALKVQRPGIRPVVEADMRLLRRAARVVARQAPRFNAVIDAGAMLDVLFDAMRPELDFCLEARNMREARDHVAGFKYLTVPTVISATPRVLVQSLAPGCSIADVRREDFTHEERAGIAGDLLAYMYRSYFLTRSFHADPHPGNILVQPGRPAALIDWGMVGRIDRPLSTSMLLVLLSLAQNDGASTARAWIEMGHATPWADVPGFIDDMTALVPQVAHASLAELNFGVSLTAVLEHSTKRGIKTNPMVAVLGKSFANLEGSIRSMCPELSLIDVFESELRHITRKLAAESVSPPQVVRAALDLMVTGNSAVQLTRGLLRDLSVGGFTVRIDQPPPNRVVHSRPFAGRRAVPDLLLVLGALAWWKRRNRRSPR